MTKQYKSINGEVTPANAMQQAGSLIDIAAHLAVRNKNFDEILTASKMWVELALNFDEVKHVERHDVTESSGKLGFQPNGE